MAYRVTKRSAEIIAKMRQARAARRIESPAPEYPAILPDLRRRIVVTDYDFGEVKRSLTESSAEGATSTVVLGPDERR